MGTGQARNPKNTSVLAPWDTPLSAKPHFLDLHKQCHPLETKCSNTQDYGGMLIQITVATSTGVVILNKFSKSNLSTKSVQNTTAQL